MSAATGHAPPTSKGKARAWEWEGGGSQALLPAWQSQASCWPSVLGMLEASALETRGPGARSCCSQGSLGHCKRALNALVLRATLWSSGPLPGLPPPPVGQSLDTGAQNLFFLLEGKGGGELPRPGESSDFNSSQTPRRASGCGGRYVTKLKRRAQGSPGASQPRSVTRWVCPCGQFTSCPELQFPVCKEDLTTFQPIGRWKDLKNLVSVGHLNIMLRGWDLG